MEANKISGAVIAIVLFLLMLIGAYWYGYSSKRCNDPTVPPITIKDTTRTVTVPITPSIDIRTNDAPTVVTTYKWRTKKIPVGVDSSIVAEILRVNDSLMAALDSLHVQRTSILDTLYGTLKDTIHIEHEVVRDNWMLHVGISPRQIQVQTEIRTIYMPPPPRKWYEEPYITIPGSMLLGIGVGYILGGK